MTFWSTSTGETVTAATTYEAPSGGGNYVFDDGSKIAGIIEDIKWDSFNGGLEFINYRVSVMAPIEDANGVKLANRKIFLKLMINGKDQSTPEKRIKESDTAKRMLAAIATNAGGGLMQVQGKPTDEQLQQHLLMKPMTFRLGKWEMVVNGENKSGNYLQMVGPYQPAYDAVTGGSGAPKAQAQAVSAKNIADDMDSIPF